MGQQAVCKIATGSINFIATMEDLAFSKSQMCVSFHVQISSIEIYASNILAHLGII